MQTQFPSGPIPAVDPVTNTIIDIRPLLTLLHTKYNGDKEQLVGDLHQLSDYIMRNPNDAEKDSAPKLRKMYGLIADLSVAFDSIREIPQH
ncbi:hypothetical protein [Hymenobacter norwichensis]|uniref:hypothetical protein n=1 Tax=Hymenobacter norwichensis TaxID=223903 RepID=UPI0003B36FA4|nr:hypothetical protein [Hymenobacter norwichensis]